MNKKNFFLFFICLPFLCWGQGQIVRPKKNEPAKKETPKPTQIPKQPNSLQNPIKQTDEYSNLEIINGISINWASDVTPIQKSMIKNLLNNMVYVAGGSFMMGSDSDKVEKNQKPTHKENVNNFYINKYEVSQSLWKTIMGYNPSNQKGDNLPVESITWDECFEFTRKLSLMTGLKFKLPSEVEWEFAAQGGNNSRKYIYSGSNDYDKISWNYENSGDKTKPIGTKEPNELGIYDMTGNVWEWTSDGYSDSYNDKRSSYYYVYRGGNWSSRAQDIPITVRGHGDHNRRYSEVGLRLALDF